MRRAAPFLVAVALAAGCGSSDEAPEGGDGAPESAGGAAEAPPVEFADTYEGSWSASEGLALEVTDDGQSVTGALTEDPDGALDALSFELSRERDGLKGTARFETVDASGSVRWELLPAGDGDLEGRRQTAWLDEETGELIVFDQNPEWAPLSFDVARPEPEPEPEPEPTEPEPTEPEPTEAGAEPEPEPTAVAMADTPEGEGTEPEIEDPRWSDDGSEGEDDGWGEEEDPGWPEEDPDGGEDPGWPGEDPGAEPAPPPPPEDDPPPPPPEDDPWGDEPPGWGDPEDLEDDIAQATESEGDEEARRLAEERRAREEERRRERERLRERRMSAEALSRMLLDAIKAKDPTLYSACWITGADASFLQGARGADLLDLAKRSRDSTWSNMIQRHPGIFDSTFVRLEGTPQDGHEGQEVVDGRLIYRTVAGEEESLPLEHLVEVEDGSWKIAKLD